MRTASIVELKLTQLRIWFVFLVPLDHCKSPRTTSSGYSENIHVEWSVHTKEM